MGFGGGGGTIGISNHVHDNTIGEGGSLQKQTIVTISGTIIPIEAFL